jgi:SpoU rRNA methylase family enzyme
VLLFTAMSAVRGRVRGGHVETDAALPEGAEVVVISGGGDEAFDLEEAELVELESRIAAADRGEVDPAEVVLARLRRAR